MRWRPPPLPPTATARRQLPSIRATKEEEEEEGEGEGEAAEGTETTTPLPPTLHRLPSTPHQHQNRPSNNKRPPCWLPPISRRNEIKKIIKLKPSVAENAVVVANRIGIIKRAPRLPAATARLQQNPTHLQVTGTVLVVTARNSMNWPIVKSS